MFKRCLLLGLTPWCFAAGCVFGGDTGTESEWPLCGDRGEETPIDQDAETVLGTARALAQRATVESDGALAYWRIEQGQSVPSETRAHIRVIPDATSARLVAHHDRRDAKRACEPSLEMDARIEIESADGAFNERFEGTLSGTSSSTGTSTPSISAAARSDYAARGGSYRTEAFAGVTPLEYTIGVRLESHTLDPAQPSPAHWRGYLTLEAPKKNAVSAAVAEW